MRFSVLASGSSGNAIFVESDRVRLLVDAGLSGRELTRRLHSIGVDPGQLDGIVVSHEHGDHILGVGIMARKYSLPVYIHPDTLVASAAKVGWIPEVIPLKASCPLTIGNMAVTPFSIPHDAVNPFGFTFCANGKKLGLATDMGYVPALVRERLRGCQSLILESNHDLQMLREGPYAWPLKQRVMSRHGHLSNGDSSDLIGDLLHDRLESVVLAHISQVNNNLRLAYGTAEAVLQASGRGIRLFAARQDDVGTFIEVAQSGPPPESAIPFTGP